GSDIIKAMGADVATEEVRQAVLNVLDQHFRPEFLNRLDEIIIFHSLSREHIGKIVDIQLKRLQNLLAERQITLELTPEAKAFLSEKGYDPVFGARPLKRAIQRYLQDPLAVALLDGKVQNGDHVVVEEVDGELHFNPVREAIQ
ncbi:MAG: ATP-dependent chaperone ClpB, partial [Chloroflexi bacterium]